MNRKGIAALAGLGILLALPFVTPAYFLHLLIQILLWGFIYTAWSIMGRFGLVSLGHGAFMGIGAYVPALLWNYFDVTPWLGIPIGIILSALLGVISELQKHHIKFTVLLATNPSDQLFLARYLRAAYPQGRVVVTAPDLLLCREDDTLLHGVLGLNTYPLLPGLDDTLGHYGEPSSPPQAGPHEDRLFVSSLSVGEFNAMVGLLALTQATPRATDEKSAETQSLLNRDFVPVAPYAEYAPPAVQYEARADAQKEAPHRPLLWLTILGRDGYWPIVALSREALVSTDGFEPVVSLPRKKGTPDIPTTLHESLGQLLPHKQPPSPKPQETLAQSQSHGDDSADTPPAWNLTLCICLLVLSLHAILSWKGTALADSESRAQFARNSASRAYQALKQELRNELDNGDGRGGERSAEQRAGIAQPNTL